MTVPRKPLLTDEEIKSASWRWGREQPSIHLPDLVVGFEAGARFAIVAMRREREVREKLVEALIVNVENCGCGMPKPCDWEEIAAVVADDLDNINNYCDSCLGAFAALAAAKEIE